MLNSKNLLTEHTHTFDMRTESTRMTLAIKCQFMNEMYIFHLQKLIFKMVGKVNFCFAAEQYIPSGYSSEPFHGQLLCNK